MSVTPYQIIVPLVSLITVFYAWNLVMRRRKTMWEAILWTVFWGMIAAISFYPELLDYISYWTGIQKRENAVFVTGLGILSFIVFYLVIRLEELEQRQTRMVRKIALRDADLHENDKK